MIFSLYTLFSPNAHPLKMGGVVLITGGVQGLGLEIAKQIARESKDISIIIVDI